MTDDLTLHYKWFDVVPLPQHASRQTRDYEIVECGSIGHGDVLGKIVWYPRWEQYAFQPAPVTVVEVWGTEALRDVCDAIAKINARRTP